MRHFIVSGTLLALVAGLVPGAPAQAAERVFPYDYRVETLGNGLKVILVPMSSGGLVAYWSIVRTGSRDEYEPGHTGFAHFFEHMMFRGTEKYPSDAYNGLVTKMGADANAFTSSDLTAYHLGIAAEDLETVIEIESDRFRNLAYSEQDFRTEAGAVYGEYRKNRTRPIYALYEALQRTAYTRHTYGHMTIGFEDDIKLMPERFDYSRTFFSRYYRPENVVLLVAGDIDPASTMALITEHYGDWEPGYVPPAIVPEPEQTAERRVDVDYDGQTLPWLAVAYKADAFDPANRRLMSLGLLGELAFGETSEIHKKLVLDEQRVESIGANYGMPRDPGLISIISRVKQADDVPAVLTEIDATIRRYAETEPDARRLADLKSRERYEFLMNLETPDSVASRLARFIAVSGGVEAVDAMFATYETITPADIQEAAKHYLVPTRRTIVTLRGK